jgi:hypothetical protein
VLLERQAGRHGVKVFLTNACVKGTLTIAPERTYHRVMSRSAPSAYELLERYEARGDEADFEAARVGAAGPPGVMTGRLGNSRERIRSSSGSSCESAGFCRCTTGRGGRLGGWPTDNSLASPSC